MYDVYQPYNANKYITKVDNYKLKEYIISIFLNSCILSTLFGCTQFVWKLELEQDDKLLYKNNSEEWNCLKANNVTTVIRKK